MGKGITYTLSRIVAREAFLGARVQSFFLTRVGTKYCLTYIGVEYVDILIWWKWFANSIDLNPTVQKESLTGEKKLEDMSYRLT